MSGWYLHVTKGWRGSDGPAARPRGKRNRRQEKDDARAYMLAAIAAEREAERKRWAALMAMFA